MPGSETFHIIALPITSIMHFLIQFFPTKPAMSGLWQTSNSNLFSPGGSNDELCPLFQLLCFPDTSANRKKLQPQETIPDVISTKIKGLFLFTVSLVHVKNVVLGPNTDKTEFVLKLHFIIYEYVRMCVAVMINICHQTHIY